MSDARKVLDLDAAATPGPWNYDETTVTRTRDNGTEYKAPAADLRGGDREWLGFVDHSEEPEYRCDVRTDADLICYYRTAAPALAREVLALREQVSRLTAERDEAVGVLSRVHDGYGDIFDSDLQRDVARCVGRSE